MPVEMGLGRSCTNPAEMLLADDRQQIEYSMLGERTKGCVMWFLIFIAIAMLAAPETSAHEYCPKAECEETKQKIRQIQSKMRQGYTRKQGEKLEADLRKYRAIRSKRCR